MIADTSVWIEFLKAREPVFSRLELQLRQRKVVAVECVFGELLQGARSDQESKIILGYWENLPKAADQGIWLEAGRISSGDKLHARGVGLIDLAILAAARRSRLRIWTLDKRFKAILSPSEFFDSET